MKLFGILFLLSCINTAFAHSPDLSNLMIYEQNGKTILLLKSSLTAFEGEIDYHFKKDAYKTPDEFKQLVIKHFEKNCIVIINNDTIRFVNPQVQLGHETTLFAEMENAPNKITAYFVSNTFFKDMPSNQCELILTTNGLPQKQYILLNSNQHAVKFTIENGNWVIVKSASAISKANPLLLIGVFLIILCLTGLAIKHKYFNKLGLLG